MADASRIWCIWALAVIWRQLLAASAARAHLYIPDEDSSSLWKIRRSARKDAGLDQDLAEPGRDSSSDLFSGRSPTLAPAPRETNTRRPVVPSLAAPDGIQAVQPREIRPLPGRRCGTRKRKAAQVPDAGLEIAGCSERLVESLT